MRPTSSSGSAVNTGAESVVDGGLTARLFEVFAVRKAAASDAAQAFRQTVASHGCWSRGRPGGR